ncbi:MAG TPA: preprotein translocase subunit SecG [Chitinophagaceae bacterium]|nr:preprotein translocase subunit SecG [Chitinophagaceae bacterium]
MMIVFLILILLASAVLGFIILVQNPKGGGLAGNVAGLSNQYMGVKQTTDLLEKGTWIFALVIALLCLGSAFFIPKSISSRNPNLRPGTNNSAPANQNQNPPANPNTPRPNP